MKEKYEIEDWSFIDKMVPAKATSEAQLPAARCWAAWRCPWCGWSNNRQAEGLDACDKCKSETATQYSPDGESLFVKWGA